MQRIDEPRTLIKIPVKLRERIRKNAKRNDNMKLMDYVEMLVNQDEAENAIYYAQKDKEG